MFACVYVCVLYVYSAHGSQKSGRLPKTGVTGSCKLSCGYWESIPGPSKEQQVLVVSGTPLAPIYRNI